MRFTPFQCKSAIDSYVQHLPPFISSYVRRAYLGFQVGDELVPTGGRGVIGGGLHPEQRQPRRRRILDLEPERERRPQREEAEGGGRCGGSSCRGEARPAEKRGGVRRGGGHGSVPYRSRWRVPGLCFVFALLILLRLRRGGARYGVDCRMSLLFPACPLLCVHSIG